MIALVGVSKHLFLLQIHSHAGYMFKQHIFPSFIIINFKQFFTSIVINNKQFITISLMTSSVVLENDTQQCALLFEVIENDLLEEEHYNNNDRNCSVQRDQIKKRRITKNGNALSLHR